MTAHALKAPADGFVSSFPDTRFDALLVVSFGGPEGMDDVIPFLENVTRGRNVPRERLEEVAHHYALFEGVSPINAQNRALIDALRPELDAHGIELPIYFGNRNWHPFLADTLREMADDGVERALAFFTSAYSVVLGLPSVPGGPVQRPAGGRSAERRRCCGRARSSTIRGGSRRMPTTSGARSPSWNGRCSAPRLHGALDPARDGARVPLRRPAARVVPPRGRERRLRRLGARLPEPQRPAAGAVARARHRRPPCCGRARAKSTSVVISPIGFVSDHLEVLYDLDVEARDAAAELGLQLVRASSASTHPAFVAMIRELVEERLGRAPSGRCVGRYAASHDVCPVDCCLPGTGRPSPWARRQPCLGRLLLGPHAEGEAPVLVTLTVDREPPLVAAARLERQRARVDREGQLERRPRLDPGRAADLELDVVEEDDRILVPVVAGQRSPPGRRRRRARAEACGGGSPGPMAPGRGSRSRRASSRGR